MLRMISEQTLDIDE